MKQAFKPTRILMLKSHSAGIGDILRGSAAWRVLKNTWPEAELHLLLFSREPGYPSEELIRDHHLLTSFKMVDKRTDTWKEWRRFWADVQRAIGQLRADLIIDFEPDVVADLHWWRPGIRVAGERGRSASTRCDRTQPVLPPRGGITKEVCAATSLALALGIYGARFCGAQRPGLGAGGMSH